MILTYILIACALIAMVLGTISLNTGLKSPDSFKRLEGLTWAAIELISTYGLLMLSYLSFIASKL